MIGQKSMFIGTGITISKQDLCYIYFRVIIDFDPNSICGVPLTWSMAFDPPPYMHADTVKHRLD